MTATDGNARGNGSMTISYYDSISDEYAADTLAISLDGLIDRFLSYVPDGLRGGRVLDLGCGSGRDSRAMMVPCTCRSSLATERKSATGATTPT